MAVEITDHPQLGDLTGGVTGVLGCAKCCVRPNTQLRRNLVGITDYVLIKRGVTECLQSEQQHNRSHNQAGANCSRQRQHTPTRAALN
jgi:hypothetical protein